MEKLMFRKEFLKKLIYLVLGLMFFVINIFSEEVPFILRSVRSLGMGGAFTAISDDHNSFFYNPAGATGREKFTMTIAEVRATVSDDMLDFYSWYSDNEKDLENFDDLSESKKVEILNKITNEVTKYNNYFCVSAPNFNFIAPMGKLYFGLGVFDDVQAKVKMNASLLVPSVDVLAKVDVAGMFLLAYKFSDKFSAGLNAKVLSRGSIDEKRLSILEFENYDPTIQPGIGYGADLGMTYNLTEGIKLGFSASDVGGTKIEYDAVDSEVKSDGKVKSGAEARTGIIKTRYNLGVSYRPFQVFGFKNLVFAADLLDITDEDDDGKIDDFAEFCKKTHFGTELGFKHLALRAGLNSGYPTIGFGLYLWFLRFDYAYYTDELGKYAGYDPLSNHTFSVSIRF
jgi:hypothetical protein